MISLSFQKQLRDLLRYQILEDFRVAIVTFPLGTAGGTPLSNLVFAFSKISKSVYLISGGPALSSLGHFENVKVFKTVHKGGSNIIERVINYSLTELKIFCNILCLTSKVDCFFFFIGGETMVLPMLALKIFRKKNMVMPGGIIAKGYAVKHDSLSNILNKIIQLNFLLTDRLIVYSPLIVREGKWQRYQHKVLFAHEHFVDFNSFKIENEYAKRPTIVGYVGRLSEVKGILKLIEAIPIVIKKLDIQFLICGQGELDNKIENQLHLEISSGRVKLCGWVSHENLPKYLNQMKLLVLPSYTEGLPNILLEAMACGTPVLATQVGAIPDIITPGKTGFLLSSNEPNVIAAQILYLLTKPQLLQAVSDVACNWVRANFNQERTTVEWEKIFEKLLKPKATY